MYVHMVNIWKGERYEQAIVRFHAKLGLLLHLQKDCTCLQVYGLVAWHAHNDEREREAFYIHAMMFQARVRLLDGIHEFMIDQRSAQVD